MLDLDGVKAQVGEHCFQCGVPLPAGAASPRCDKCMGEADQEECDCPCGSYEDCNCHIEDLQEDTDA